MDQSVSTAAHQPTDIFGEPTGRRPIAPRSARPLGSLSGQHKYEVVYLTRNGQIAESTSFARALPAFEEAFAVLSHNAIVQTDSGLVTVEDVLPGDKVRMADGSFDTLLWRGHITLQSGGADAAARVPTLTRITADAYGYNRPTPDLVLGPAARLLHRASEIRKLTGCDTAFIPASDFVDGDNVLTLAITRPVTLYQLGFATQQRLSVNGLEIETLHPGTAFTLGLRGDALAEYLSLFPHKRSLEDFGLMDHPRLRLRDLELLR